MVIGRPNSAGIILVILTDDERVPRNLNHFKVAVFRQGNSTGRQLLMVKALGTILPEDSPFLRPLVDPICNFALDPDFPPSPIHEHSDGTWWFFEATWRLERGPFPTWDTANEALAEYCLEYQNSLTDVQKCDTSIDDEAQTSKPD